MFNQLRSLRCVISIIRHFDIDKASCRNSCLHNTGVLDWRTTQLRPPFDRLVNRLMLKGCQFKLTGETKCHLPFANIKGVDQPAILSSLIRTLVVHLSCSLLCQYSACSHQVPHFSTLAVL